MIHPKHDIIRKHLKAYEDEGRAIELEAEKVASLRKRVTGSNAVHLDFGRLDTAGGFTSDMDRWYKYNGPGPILLTPADAKRRTWDAATERSAYDRSRVTSVGADCDIVYPGMQACLLVWLDGWAARVEADRVAWAARDAVAEAVALTQPTEDSNG